MGAVGVNRTVLLLLLYLSMPRVLFLGCRRCLTAKDQGIAFSCQMKIVSPGTEHRVT
jgi:hypothetical protein